MYTHYWNIQCKEPTLRIELEAEQSYSLDKDDLQKLFSYFGEVIRVMLINKNIAHITYKDIISAYLAQQSLNQLKLPHIQARISVKWNVEQTYQSSCCSDNLFYNTAIYTGDNAFIEKDEKLANAKYTCKFEIQIENDKAFGVAKKIIGSKGANMKRIVDTCAKNGDSIVKLRLRGKGSGYKEGINRLGNEHY
jgi:RNA recognition motif-containing protein